MAPICFAACTRYSQSFFASLHQVCIWDEKVEQHDCYITAWVYIMELVMSSIENFLPEISQRIAQ